MNRVYEGIQFATVITGEVIVINAAYLIFVLVLLGLKNLLDYWEKNQNRFKSDKSKFKYLN